jgi:hypothetical protein
MPDKSRASRSEIIVKLPVALSGDRLRFAATIAAAMESAGMPAMVIASPEALADFLRGHAELILATARQCKSSGARAQLEQVARDCLLEAEKVENVKID